MSTESALDLDLQGNIENFTLPEIFQLLAAGRKSGTLGIQREDSIVMIYFDAGDVTYGYGPRQTFHLGQLLRERGKLTSEQLDEAITTQASTDNSKRLGEILIAKGFIDRADLEAVVKNQVEELLYSLLSWQSGSFKFYENQFPTDEEITVSLSVENVILEGLRRLDEQNMVRETLPDLDRVYTISASQAGRTRAVTLRASEWNIMALVNGQRTMNEVCQASSLEREESLNRLAQLKLAGIITPCEKKAPAASNDSQLGAMVNRLSHLLESYLSEKEVLRVEDRKISTTLAGKDQ
ncbi:MAG: hypothetical protein DRP45_01295 [Candidatus Zixiibacteriota bacterium]|nr:MAG: hypothetical protein DRP45_01295 [candidate division Zixibacteria bacterium]